jgi:murein DD-endopeptidase MepM/ murein hydrolase activator NlpD
MPTHRKRRTAIAAGIVAAAVLVPAGRANGSALPASERRSLPGPAYGQYLWPVRGAVLSPFEAPESPYGPGHRGIDIAASLGTPVHAAGPGRVAFAGRLGGAFYVSVDHPDGVRTTYSWLSSVAVRAGDAVEAGQSIATTGPGHPGRWPPHLHFGAKVGDVYIDPLLLLEGGSVVGLIHLAPLDKLAPQTFPGMAIPEPRGPPTSGWPQEALAPRRP